MELLPAFKIGVWNAWLLMLPLLLIPAIMSPIKKGLFKKTESTANLSKREKNVFMLSKVVLILAFLYSIVLPFKLGSLWFYIGLPISLLGIIMYIIVSINILSTPIDAPVTKGSYKYARHPMYIASILAFIGASIASASWLFLLLTILFAVTHFMNGFFEERLCLEAYGNVYRDYIQRTPKWIGFPK